MTHQDWITPDERGNTPLHILAMGFQYPETWIAGQGPRNLCLNDAPASVMTHKNIMLRNRQGMSVMHLALSSGRAAQIPSRLFTEETLSIQAIRNWFTPVHSAAYNSTLNCIPSGVLTVKMLVKATRLGLSPLQLALNRSSLDQLEPNLIHALNKLGRLDIKRQPVAYKASEHSIKVIDAAKSFLPDDEKAFYVYVALL